MAPRLGQPSMTDSPPRAIPGPLSAIPDSGPGPTSDGSRVLQSEARKTDGCSSGPVGGSRGKRGRTPSARVRAGCPDRGKSGSRPPDRCPSEAMTRGTPTPQRCMGERRDPIFKVEGGKVFLACLARSRKADFANPPGPEPGMAPRLGQPSMADSPPRTIPGPLSAIPGSGPGSQSDRSGVLQSDTRKN